MIELIGVFGGGFDPIGNHHIEIAELARDRRNLHIWVMPCFGHKFDKKTSSPEHRMKMVDLACENKTGITGSTFEIDAQHSGSTWETLQKLTAAKLSPYPVIGVDNAEIIQKWHNWEELIETYHFTVVGKKSSDEKQWFERRPHLFIPSDTVGRSTNIREAVQSNNWDLVKQSVDPKVYEYIVSQGLYQ